MEILYEDNHVIAVNKPHGMLTQGDDTNDVSLLDEVRKLIKTRDNKPGNVFVGLLHRLDRPVGGVVLFAKTSKGASRISEQIRNHSVEKMYWAVVEGTPEQSAGEVIQWLVKDEGKNVVTPYDHEVAGSFKAELTYKVLQSKDGQSLVEIHPKTGRPHQIRVAMSSLGTPIVGDVKYGTKGRSSSFKEGAKGESVVALFARSLTFDGPTTKERITAVAEPALEIFKSFEK